MNYYAFINMSIITYLVATVFLNKNFNKQIRYSFITAFLFSFIGLAAELIVTINGISLSLNMFLKLFKFSIIPLMPIICVYYIFEKNSKKHYCENQILKIYFIIYELFLYIEYFFFNLSKFYKITYIIYVISFVLATIFMFKRAFEFSKYFYNINIVELILIICFILSNMIIGFCEPNLNSNWLTISIASAFIYIYYNGIMQCIDGLTTLLNRSCFNTYLENVDEKICLIIFDVDDFKKINDTYGHNEGDKILYSISKILKDTYQPYGKCYRIGGDEFAVITKKTNIIEELNTKFISNINKQQLNDNIFPSVSYGMAEYNPKNKSVYSIIDAFKDADTKMYKCKE